MFPECFLNTEFYSWDTSFGLVNPRLTYSSLQVVFCVKPGTFFKCSLQLGWRLTGVRSTHTECSLNVPRMYLQMELAAGAIHFVQTLEGLEECVAHLKECAAIGLDAEWRPSFTKGQGSKVRVCSDPLWTPY